MSPCAALLTTDHFTCLIVLCSDLAVPCLDFFATTALTLNPFVASQHSPHLRMQLYESFFRLLEITHQKCINRR